ncbi:putative wings apart-like protein regulation of heterochromatin protein [Tanacetum coccineum]
MCDFSQYDSFIFDFSNDHFPPADKSDLYHEEFADELAHIMSLPNLECFKFKIKPDLGDLTSIDLRIRKNVSTTNVNVPLEDDQSSLFAYVVWIFLAFLTYPVACPSKSSSTGIKIPFLIPGHLHLSFLLCRVDFPDCEDSRARSFTLHPQEFHILSFILGIHSYLPHFSDQADELIILEGHNKRLNDQELDFLIAILVLLVNLVEKDGRNRSRLAGASISIPSSSGSDYEITDIILLLCSIFLVNQGAGEAAEEGRQSVWNDEDPIVREKTIVEAYSALLLAFISTERKRDTPLMGIHKVPSYIPTYELVAGHQIVYFEVTLVDSLKELGKAVVREMLFICFTKAIIWDLASWRNIHFMQQVMLVDSLKELGKRFLLTDAWGYGTGTTSLYQSHPWVLAILPNGEALGILADTTKRCEIDLHIDSTVKLTASSPFPVITFGPFASAIEVLTSLSHAVVFILLFLLFTYDIFVNRNCFHATKVVTGISTVS